MQNWYSGRRTARFYTLARHVHDMLFAGKNISSQSAFFRRALFEIENQISVRFRRCVKVRFLHVSRVFRTKLSRKMRNLRLVARIFKDNDIISVERNFALTLMKQVLSEKENAQIAVMRRSGENIYNTFSAFGHQIVDYNQFGSRIFGKVAALRNSFSEFNVSRQT